MNSDQNDTPPPPDSAIGFASNGGAKRYLIEAESTTGFVAWRLDDGTILVNAAETVDLPASPSLAFWPCAGYQDTTPSGDIISLDCHANELARLDVRRLKRLRFLDCCYNRLTELDLTGLADLEVLDADNNQLTSLDVRHLSALRILNCANNRLAQLDVSSLAKLQVFDSSGIALLLENISDMATANQYLAKWCRWNASIARTPNQKPDLVAACSNPSRRLFA